jgi:alkylation response protein AidB-like acyl-CoA dehydrogenase
VAVGTDEGGGARRLVNAAPGALGPGPGPRYVTHLLPAVAAQADEADRTRTVNPEVIAAIKRSELVTLSASANLGGRAESITQIALELEALAGACASTAWCLWNHLCVFHLFCGALGPEHHDLLGGIVQRHEWVCFPAGAGSRLHGEDRGEHLVLTGSSAFGSGSRYAEWAGVAFAVPDPASGRLGRPPDLRFSIVELARDGVGVRPTWDGASLRASSTDDVHYDQVAIPAARWSPWWGADRAGKLRDPAVPVIHPRYREDWVGLSDLWLAAMATGLAQSALDEITEEVATRKGLMGRPLVDLAGVHFNLGRAAAAIVAARAVWAAGCREVDARIAATDQGPCPPTEADELRLLAYSAQALAACESAMGHLGKVMGGNGLREGHRFERRQRDFRAMPLHINAHEDRVAERVGRWVLGLDPGRF